MDWVNLNDKINQLVQAKKIEEIRASLDSLLALTESESCLYLLTDKNSKKFKSYYAAPGSNSSQYFVENQMNHQRVTMLVNNPVDSTSQSIYAAIVSILESYHRYSLQIPVGERYLLQIISFRKEAAFSQEQVQHLNIIATALLPWGNYMVEQCEKRQRAAVEFSVEPLTKAESDVLDLLAKGMDGSEVAEARGVSKETVRSQIKCLLQKTGARHQNELLRRYYIQL
ncbi:hypothetical protein EOPP23_04345 [Endozoicomonas sp. OPT23]|uniref:helix-turn-helix transcriptional regulator n=1 Tax=Endozoicomonas sp. OPT23 TaxID=2072845 RepID=UPI00129ACF82|nr:helix-turn-helix transcriptional regulator [Endozoicomonas sp. OPT23]MRI32222.1 hypothetical protein [Endozoicomonas sp. OPT23]